MIRECQVAVVLIGTNNILQGYGAEETVSGIKAVVDRLKQQRPLMHVVSIGVFPIGADWANPAAEEARRAVNQRLREHMELEHPDDKTHYIDCSQHFLSADGGSVVHGLMPDGVHPSANGVTKWAECIKPLVHELINL